MTPAQRSRYFRDLWPAACAANNWSTRDEGRRKKVTADCMAAIRAPATDSTTALGEDEITALFCYLEFLADPDSPRALDKSARWVTCQEDYRTYNRARQADWHERSLYGHKPNKLDRDRFAGETSASAGPLDTLDPEAIRQRHITMASRHQRKTRGQKTEARKPKPPSVPPPKSPDPVPASTSDEADWPF